MIERLKTLKYHFMNSTTLDDSNIEDLVQSIVKIVFDTIARKKPEKFYGTLEIGLSDDVTKSEEEPIYFQEFVSGDEPSESYKEDDSIEKMVIGFDIYSVIDRRGNELPFEMVGKIAFLFKSLNGETIDPRMSLRVYEEVWKKIEPLLNEDDCTIDVRWENKPSSSAYELPSDIL